MACPIEMNAAAIQAAPPPISAANPPVRVLPRNQFSNANKKRAIEAMAISWTTCF
ncbi:hypothetical protein [Novipirellula maiorica]|uniref:hypothetical protein n=1 Tax=Novipirellula maiorica TaxID=1265734 RepID=UPI001360B4C6